MGRFKQSNWFSLWFVCKQNTKNYQHAPLKCLKKQLILSEKSKKFCKNFWFASIEVYFRSGRENFKHFHSIQWHWIVFVFAVRGCVWCLQFSVFCQLFEPEHCISIFVRRHNAIRSPYFGHLLCQNAHNNTRSPVIDPCGCMHIQRLLSVPFWPRYTMCPHFWLVRLVELW